MGLLDGLLGGSGYRSPGIEQQVPYSHLAAMLQQQQIPGPAYGTQAYNNLREQEYRQHLQGLQQEYARQYAGITEDIMPKRKHVDSVEVKPKNEIVPYEDWEHKYEWF